jgi:hypothetical protein
MTAPRIDSAYNRPYPSTIEVYFTLEMDPTTLDEPTNYMLNLGAYVTSVEVLNNYAVLLTTENLFGHPEFILSISESIKSIGGVSFDTSSTATIKLTEIDEGIYALSAANGRLKSGKTVKQIEQDDEYFYILTETGIDVVDKESLFNKGYILNSSGFSAIAISGD